MYKSAFDIERTFFNKIPWDWWCQNVFKIVLIYFTAVVVFMCLLTSLAVYFHIKTESQRCVKLVLTLKFFKS